MINQIYGNLVKLVANNKKKMISTGCLGLVHWDDPEGWYGEAGGRRVQDGEHMYTGGGFISIFEIGRASCRERV